MPHCVPSQVVNLIDKIFPEATQDAEWSLNNSHAASIAGIVRMVDEIPSELLIMDADSYSELLAAVEALRQSLMTWPHQGASHNLNKVRGLYKLNPISIVRRALSKCSDEYPSPDVGQLGFISDAEFRDAIRLDISRVNRSIASNEYKAATILAGSAIEALLLWKLQEMSDQEIASAWEKVIASGALKESQKRNLDELSLRPYSELCAVLGLIRGETLQHLKLATNYRNLVHPGRALRLKEACNLATTYATAAALEFVLSDLSQHRR